MASSNVGFFARVWSRIKHIRTVTKALDVHVGTDSQGNKFFERVADPEKNIRLQRRIEPADGDIWNAPEVSPEWLAWLRSRRTIPPTQEEIDRNNAQMLRTQHRAAELKRLHRTASNRDGRENLPSLEEQSPAFPKYDEFETVPGEFKWK